MKKNLFTLILVLFVFNMFAESNIYAPTLVSPSNGALNQSPYVVLNWDAVPGAWTYKVEMSLDSNFVNPVIFICSGTATVAKELLFDSKYFWHVKAIGFTDSSAWSVQWKFTTIDKVTLLAPVDSSDKEYVKAFRKWTAMTGILKYEWEIDSAITFDSPLFRNGSDTGTATTGYSKQLFFGQSYFIRMRALHALDTSVWTETRMFTTLDTFNLRRPFDNYDTLYMVKVAMKWDWIGSSYYDVALAFDSAMTSPLIFSVDSSSILKNSVDTAVYSYSPILLFDTIYYWTVRARNGSDTTAWMTVRSFATIDTVALISPLTAAVNTSTLPELKWKKLLGTDYYILQYDTTALFENPIDIVVETDTLNMHTFTTELLDHQTYYWRVKSFAAADSSNWCKEWSFTTGSGIGIDDNRLTTINVNTYPNPCRGNLNVDIDCLQSGKISLSLSNIIGQVVLTREILVKTGKNSTALNLGLLTNGIYLLKIQGENYVNTRKVILDK